MATFPDLARTLPQPWPDPRRIYRSIAALLRRAEKPSNRGGEQYSADRPLMRAALAAYALDGPTLPRDVAAEAAAFALLVAWYGQRAPSLADDFVRFWGAVSGPSFAVAALERAYRMHVEVVRRGSASRLALLLAAPLAGSEWPAAERPIPWRGVRDLAARLDPASLEAVVVELSSLPASTPLPARVALAAGFGQLALCAAELASHKLGAWALPLAVFAPSVAMASEILFGASSAALDHPSAVEALRFEIVAHHGEAAAPLLVRLICHYLEVPRTARALAAALAQLHSSEVATFFEAQVDSTVLGAEARAYLAARRRPGPAEHGRAEEDSARLRSGPSSEVEAEPHELPRILRDPSWMARGAPKSKPLKLKPLPINESLVYAAGERESLERPDLPEDPASESALLARIARSERKAPDSASYEHLARLPRATLAEVLASLDPARLAIHDIHLLPLIVARAGEVAISFALRAFPSCPEEVVFALSRARSPRAAPHMAEVFACSKAARARGAAQAWLDAFPDAAAQGLLPFALGKKGKQRDAAVAAIRHLASSGNEQIVSDAASRHGDEALGALRALLSADGATRGAAPVLPSFLDVKRLPRPRLAASGKLVPQETLEAMLGLLKESPLETRRSELSDVCAACEPESLAALARALFEGWLSAGKPASECWMLTALAHLSGDTAAARLPSQIQAWADEDDEGPALHAIEVLAHLGTDGALAYLQTLASRSKGKLRKHASESLDIVAAAHLLSREELAEALVPPVALDDARKDEARKISAKQLRRLESAMCLGERWSHASFQQLLAKPLLAATARNLVWGVADAAGGCSCTFQVAEDGSLRDLTGARLLLPAGASVGLMHPIELDDVVKSAWCKLITPASQPFAQLERPTFRVAAHEAERDELYAFQTQVARLTRVLGARGWARDMYTTFAGDALLMRASKRVSATLVVVVDLNDDEEWKLRFGSVEPVTAHVRLVREAHPLLYCPNSGPDLPPLTFAAVREATLSEVLWDLQELHGPRR